MQRLTFARHGESEANVLRVVSNRPGVHPLTATGKAQASALAEAMQGRISRVYSSPLLRALQTAEIVGRSLGLSCQVVDALREYDCGDLEGRSDADAWAAHARWIDDWFQGHNRDRGPAGGESFEEIRHRFVPFVRSLLDSPEAGDAAPLLIGHGGVYRLMLALILDNVDQVFVRAHGIGHSTVIVAEAGRGRLLCTQWGDVRLPALDAPQGLL